MIGQGNALVDTRREESRHEGAEQHPIRRIIERTPGTRAVTPSFERQRGIVAS